VAAGRTLAAASRTSKARSGGKAPVVSGRRPARRSVVVAAGRQQHDHHARGLKTEKTAIYKGQRFFTAYTQPKTTTCHTAAVRQQEI
jgi:hypothetical protein